MVDAVAEAGDLFLVCEHLFDVLDGVGTGFVDGIEQAHGGLIGSPMKGTFKSADGTGDGGVDVGQRGGDDARSEGAGVQLVVGMEDERNVEGACSGFGRLFAVEHPEEVCGVGERLVGVDDGFALADAVKDGDDHRDLGGEAIGFADVCVVAAVGLVGIVDAEERDRSAEDLHGRGVCRNAAEEVDDLWIEFAGGGKMLGEVSKLGGRGKLSEPEEIGALLEGG